MPWRRESRPGQVADLPPDVIHGIENPNDDYSLSLHIYGGDFTVLMDKRSLWRADDHEETGYSFEGLVAESVRTMKLNNNDKGLDALVDAIPKTKPLVDSL